jgi:hypothetical protein
LQSDSELYLIVNQRQKKKKMRLVGIPIEEYPLSKNGLPEILIKIKQYFFMNPEYI